MHPDPDPDPATSHLLTSISRSTYPLSNRATGEAGALTETAASRWKRNWFDSLRLSGVAAGIPKRKVEKGVYQSVKGDNEIGDDGRRDSYDEDGRLEPSAVALVP